MARAILTRSYLEALLPLHRVESVGRESFRAYRFSLHTITGTSSLFFATLQGAFEAHFGVALRPEVIWHMVMDAVATVVKRHPDAYGAWFSHDPREKTHVEVRDDSIAPGLESSDWGRTIGLFDAALRKAVPDGIMDVLLPELSTATAETRAASLVAFMDAASPYHTYGVHSFCGIPRIRLDGSPEDWATIARHASALRTVFATLDWYFDDLCPVLDTIAEQAAGAPIDETFWRSIYHYEGGSGRSHVDGWSTVLLAYLRCRTGRGPVKLIEKPAGHSDWRNDRHGIAQGGIPSHVSTVDFTWNFMGTKMPMKFVGGVLGVDLEDECTLVPRLSYAVVHQRE